METGHLPACTICSHSDSICKRGYHHRCCRPPIDDALLISLIRASKKNKPGKGLSVWKCRGCSSGVGPAQNPHRGATARASGNSSSLVNTINYMANKDRASRAPMRVQQPEVISISDDEDEAPVVRKQPEAHKSTESSNSLPSASRMPADGMDIDMPQYSIMPERSVSQSTIQSPPISSSDSERDPSISRRFSNRSETAGTARRRFKNVPYTLQLNRPLTVGRRPRKVPAKKLDKHNKTSGQKSFAFVVKEYGHLPSAS
ncbi:hypothetical protein DFH11DRAFT_1577620 [Phellopilus nigrolimitatus]|nr:hypothetical protein DFH11DRAFT_1577620 [Phellopilus nigrolimitatus]